MQAAQLFVGLDIGGTKTAVLLVDSNNTLLGKATLPTRAATPDELLAAIARAIHTALTEANATPQQIESIGMGVPGQVDPATGIVQMAVNLNLQTYPLGAAVSAHFKVPTFLENDVRTAAIGAFNHLCQTEPVQTIAYLSIGTGIAAGLVLNGRLYRGHNGMAGEIGHMLVETDGEPCKCGMHGCLETIVSGPAIVRQFLAINPQTKSQVRHAGDVYCLADEGHPVAQNVVKHVSQYLARAIQWLIMSYDVEKVVLGGGVTRSGHRFLAPILREMATLRQQSSLAAELLLDENLHLISPDFNPGLWGAVQLAKQIFLEEVAVATAINAS
ncbi:ROK family protein [Candidatus Leptofilum sp.]|uniref:ROK family protein n=1 Tax=Candidatus Leptofilum sp. TaxID=3241576 RepID=UPI003B5BFF25